MATSASGDEARSGRRPYLTGDDGFDVDWDLTRQELRAELA